MTEAVIVGAARSPIGRAFKGSLVSLSPLEIAAQVTQSLLDEIAVPLTEVEDIYLGTAAGGGESAGNLARLLALRLGADSVPGTSVNRYCASSLQTTRMAFHAIRAGEGESYLSVGVEMVSRPRGTPPTDGEIRGEAFTRHAANEREWRDPRELGLMPDPFVDMGVTAEIVAELRGVTRAEMDEFALRSQRLTEERREEGFWAREITPVRLADGTTISADDSPRPSTTLEGLAALEPRFRPGGSVTAGNSCPLNDGAAAVLIMSDKRAAALGLEPIARIVSTGVSALSPEIMGLGPVEASRRALASAGMSMSDIDQVEINEAFAAQVIPSVRELGIDLERVNANGGGIALGHPYGMTGARITRTLINSLRRHDGQFGLETMCVAGGQGMAMVVERLR